MVGKIYLAKIYFTDLSQYKIRPVLIIREIGDDCICLQLTSQYKEHRIKLSNDDLIDGVLKKNSLIVVPKNFTLNKQILDKYIAQISDQKLMDIFDMFCKEIGCNSISKDMK